MRIENLIKLLLREAKLSNQRRLIVFCTLKNEDFLPVLKNFLGRNQKNLIVHDGDELGKDLETKLKGKCEALTFAETTKVLGKTYDNLVIDLRNYFSPNSLGRLFGIVRGGGLIFLLVPYFKEWGRMKNRFHEILTTLNFPLEQVRNNFLKRFIEKLLKGEGILIYDFKKGLIKESKQSVVKKIRKRKLKSFKSVLIPNKIQSLCVTQDQLNVLKHLERFWKDPQKSTFILKANRGRGKSAALGLFLAALIKNFEETGKKFSIGVTAPEFENVATLFQFLKLGLKKVRIKFKVEENSLLISKGRITIEYKKPVRVVERYYDLVVVDEAAGIPIPFLYRIIKNFYKTIFSSTIHGYEGAGRGFSLKFLKGIRELKLAKIFEFEMEEPIRYDKADLIEKWLFDTLLLDAEPPPINLEILKGVKRMELEYEKIKRDEWIWKEDELKDFFGIYIFAHYRNRPNDLALLLDAPHHFPRCIKCKGVVVNAIHLSWEGGLKEEILKKCLEEGIKPRGHVIPFLFLKHYRELEFPKLKGWRIVRIATHPELINLGIGGYALEKIEEEAKANEMDWVGVSFGATPELLNFWTKNGYIPFHISLERNTISGEYSVALVKPLNEKARKIIERINYEFRLRILGSLMDVHFDINPEIPLFLLRNFFETKPHYQLQFTENQKARMEAFLEEKVPYESVAEVCRELIKYYFLDGREKPSFKTDELKIMILKSLLVKSWKTVAKQMDLESREVINKFRNSMKKLWEHYGRES